MTPLEYLRSAPMASIQYRAVSICLVINFLDGFDVLAIAFAAPEISAEWSVSSTNIGILFSAGLAGMVAGALFLSPFADHYGRRPLILTCLYVISAGMLLSAAAQNVSQLVAARLLTGLGVGAMLSSLTTMVAEYSNDRHRKLAISILQSGYPVGAIIAGICSAILLREFGWRSIFLVGGVLSLLMIPLVYWGLPESINFLVRRCPKNALLRLNIIMSRMGGPGINSMPRRESPNRLHTNVRMLFSSTYLGSTMAIWVSFIATLSAFYFVTNWTPKILIDAGMSRDAGISGGVLIALGGVSGGLVLGWLSGRLKPTRVIATYMVCAMLAMMAFGFLGSELLVMLSIAFCIGFFLAGAIIGLYALAPDLYPAEIRNTGIGWALGIGRLGAVIGPYIAGVLIAAGWDRSEYYIALSLPIVASLVAVLWLQGHLQEG